MATNVRANLLSNVANWYTKQYPKDPDGGDINKNINFIDVLSALNKGEDIYNIIGISDSIMRERIFEKLSKMTKLPYDTIYEMWLKK